MGQGQGIVIADLVVSRKFFQGSPVGLDGLLPLSVLVVLVALGAKSLCFFQTWQGWDRMGGGFYGLSLLCSQLGQGVGVFLANLGIARVLSKAAL